MRIFWISHALIAKDSLIAGFVIVALETAVFDDLVFVFEAEEIFDLE